MDDVFELREEVLFLKNQTVWPFVQHTLHSAEDIDDTRSYLPSQPVDDIDE